LQTRTQPDATLGAVVSSADFLNGLQSARVLVKSGLLGPLRPDKYVRMAAALSRRGISSTVGMTLAARRSPDRAALIDERGTVTWAELDQRTDALAAALDAEVGDLRRIALLARNHRGFVEALVAASKLGADLLLLNTGFAGPQLAEVVGREHADLIVYDQEFEAIVADLPGATRRVVAWQDGNTDNPTLNGLIDGHVGATAPAKLGAGRVILLTSGTTGTPKGASRGADAGISQIVSAIERVPWHTDDTVVIAAPMFHAWGYGCLLMASLMANTVVMRRRFDPEQTLALVARHRAAGLAVVPIMIQRIEALPDAVQSRYPCSSLRFVTASGSAMEAGSLLRFMDRFGDVVYSHYNATEAGMIAIATPADLRAAPRSTGRPASGCTVRILDDDGTEAAVGEIGEIAVRNGTQFEGYTHGGSKEIRDGFMLTGDVGRMDTDGRLTVEGRADDMIVSGGENVYPGEVEDVLAAHEDVLEAAVIAVYDREYGQRLAGFVVLREGSSIDGEQLRTHVKSSLANYKVPRSVSLLDEMPRNATGKVMKRNLAEPPQ
jgi:acyl-CoA synthetase (AMP-forming)/AMP-acid ligase II